jgi:DNA-binding transcriptional ArsR family regulator
MMPPDDLSTTFAALADPTRRAILARLAAGEASVSELAEPFDMSLPAISKHLKVLERAGLIARSRSAQRRPCRLEAARLKDVADWVERYRRFWEESLDRLEAYLGALQGKDADHGRDH